MTGHTSGYGRGWRPITGEISFAELDAAIQGWIAHVAHADSWGLRRHVLESLVIRPAEHRRAVAAKRRPDL